jgi:hypothetical protein
VNAEQALYETVDAKHYLAAFFIFFIPVSWLDDPHDPARAGTANAGRRFCAGLTLHRFQAAT